ncbi:hypothetical protein LSAT2_004576 [Lamellibrachia satsuma]|nr:hypothetical protein LSAT2_004576 [Lamellibrachia satsuma]
MVTASDMDHVPLQFVFTQLQHMVTASDMDHVPLQFVFTQLQHMVTASEMDHVPLQFVFTQLQHMVTASEMDHVLLQLLFQNHTNALYVTSVGGSVVETHPTNATAQTPLLHTCLHCCSVSRSSGDLWHTQELTDPFSRRHYCSDGRAAAKPDVGACISNPCWNGGTCEVQWYGGYMCYCGRSYTGQQCETDVGACISNPCWNGGTCEVQWYGGYMCYCGRSYTGQQCETGFGACVSNPCWNGGTCEASWYGGYTCYCGGSYTGQQCETRMNACQSYPCKNGGTCADNSYGYQCYCAQGYTGKACEINRDPCSSGPCQNDGKCYGGEDGYRCYCGEMHKGFNCEIYVGSCGSNPCHNGGKCYHSDAGYTCVCGERYKGPNCEIGSDTGTSMTLIAAGVGGCLLVGVIIGFVVCCAWRRRNQNSVQTHSANERSASGIQPAPIEMQQNVIPHETEETVPYEPLSGHTKHSEIKTGVYAAINKPGEARDSVYETIDEKMSPVSDTEYTAVL